jgi:hypothetical protein
MQQLQQFQQQQQQFQAAVMQQLEQFQEQQQQFQEQQQQFQEQQQQFQEQQQQFQQQLGQVLEVGVTSHNAARRLHNRSAHFAGDPLLQLRKERQPGTPEAAAYGALPPAGLFPVTHGQALNVSEAALHALH